MEPFGCFHLERTRPSSQFVTPTTPASEVWCMVVWTQAPWFSRRLCGVQQACTESSWFLVDFWGGSISINYSWTPSLCQRIYPVFSVGSSCAYLGNIIDGRGYLMWTNLNIFDGFNPPKLGSQLITLSQETCQGSQETFHQPCMCLHMFISLVQVCVRGMRTQFIWARPWCDVCISCAPVLTTSDLREEKEKNQDPDHVLLTGHGQLRLKWIWRICWLWAAWIRSLHP